MNIVVISKGQITNYTNLVDVCVGYETIELISDHRYLVFPGDEICFNKQRYTVAKETIQDIANKIKVHKHNSEVMSALRELK